MIINAKDLLKMKEQSEKHLNLIFEEKLLALSKRQLDIKHTYSEEFVKSVDTIVDFITVPISGLKEREVEVSNSNKENFPLFFPIKKPEICSITKESSLLRRVYQYCQEVSSTEDKLSSKELLELCKEKFPGSLEGTLKRYIARYYQNFQGVKIEKSNILRKDVDLNPIIRNRGSLEEFYPRTRTEDTKVRNYQINDTLATWKLCDDINPNFLKKINNWDKSCYKKGELLGICYTNKNGDIVHIKDKKGIQVPLILNITNMDIGIYYGSCIHKVKKVVTALRHFNKLKSLIYKNPEYKMKEFSKDTSLFKLVSLKKIEEY